MWWGLKSERWFGLVADTGFPAEMGKGKQSSWYPGLRADRALELAAEITDACAANKWAAEIPQWLHETHLLLAPPSGSSKQNAGDSSQAGTGAGKAKASPARGDDTLASGLLTTPNVSRFFYRVCSCGFGFSCL